MADQENENYLVLKGRKFPISKETIAAVIGGDIVASMRSQKERYEDDDK